ncbi:von Hippel-Lindau disease tumor suppressor [Neocloeon triangulifer]|uniref:von Hippel-Lindau disease tumor suppressor n=1 Tax=Neocloeon triangulifer TaxID=2078957 RepID=UPI00286F2ABA|nr:von Hippel-Lindau disease tumor suppressor [Neocloeon triangulifer]
MPATELRSIESLQPAYPTFINGTTRNVDIVWLNFSGQPIVYKTLQPRRPFRVNTFVTHPWLFVDADSRDRLLGRGQLIYMPEAPNSEPIKRHTVLITIPVYPLLVRSLQVLRDCLKPEIINMCMQSEKLPEAIQGLRLPKTLQVKLVKFIRSSQEFRITNAEQ